MKTKKCILYVLLLFGIVANAQPEIFIKNIEVSKIIVEIKENIFNEDDKNGPYLKGILCFKNNSKDTIKLLLSESKLTAKFNYNRKIYFANMISTLKVQNDTLILYPSQTHEEIFYTNIFLGTSLLKKKPENIKGNYIFNYTNELLIALPTFRLNYRDSNYNIETKQIQNIEIKDY